MAVQTNRLDYFSGIARRVSSVRRLKRSDLPLVIPSGILIVIAGACYLGPSIAHLGPPNGHNLEAANLPAFSPGHFLGTDALGNDLLTRSLYGGRASFEIGLGAVALGFLVGSNIGVVAGFFGGKVESFIMRVLDVFLAFPALILALAISAYLGPSLRNVIFAISFFTVPTYGRIARAESLKQRSRDFVVVARVIGGRPGYVALRHVYPNVLPTLMTFVPIGIGITMLVEAALSFLGLGIRPPQPSWGNMIAQGQEHITTAPAEIIVPGLFLFVTITCLNLAGEQIRLRWGK